MRFDGGTGEGLSSRGPGEGGRYCRSFPRVAALEFFHFQRAGSDLLELLGMGAVGALDGAVEFGRTRGKHKQMQAALLAGEFELGGEFGAAIDLHRPDGKGHAVLQGIEELSCGLGGGASVSLDHVPAGDQRRGR